MWQIFSDEYLTKHDFELVNFTSTSDDGIERITATVRAFGRSTS